MRSKKILLFCILLALCACSGPSDEAIQTAIAQTENAKKPDSDALIETAIVQTLSANNPIATEEPQADYKSN